MARHPSLMRGAAVLLGLAAAVLAGCSKAPPPGAAPGKPAALFKMRFKTDWYPQAEHGGFYQAQAKGFYKAAGIDVEIIPGGPGVLVSQLMLTRQTDLGMIRSDDIVRYAAQGLPFVLVGVYMEHDPQAILVHEESRVRTFADLNNRSIMGVPGSCWIDYLKSHYHIDFRLIPMNYGIAQFMADTNFIQQCFVTNEPYFVKKNGGHPRTLLMSDSGFDPYRTIFATQAYVRDHPAEVRAFVAASLLGWNDFMNGDPSPAKALIEKANPNMSDEFVEYSIKAMRDSHIVAGRSENDERIGLMSRRRLRQQVEDLAQLKLIPQLIPVDKFARFDLMPKELQSGVP